MTHSINHLLTHSIIHSLTISLTQSSIHSLSHSLNQSLTYSLTAHSLIHNQNHSRAHTLSLFVLVVHVIDQKKLYKIVSSILLSCAYSHDPATTATDYEMFKGKRHSNAKQRHANDKPKQDTSITRYQIYGVTWRLPRITIFSDALSDLIYGSSD